MSEIIRLENVVKMFDNGIRAINGINLSISKGECVVVSGPPGSGRTTLARLIAGMDKPSVGKVMVLEKPMHEMEPDAAAAFRNQNIGMLHRNPAFLDNLSVLENTVLPLMLRGEGKEQRNGKAKEQLKTFGLQYAAHAHPSQLTPLERYKLAVVRALIVKPKILLLDDFAADLTETDEIAGILHALCHYGDYTVIELTGNAKGLICRKRILTLDRGKIQEEWT